MGNNVLRDLVLVLNKNWLAVRIETAMMSIKRCFRGQSVLVDENTAEVFFWDEWLKYFSVSREKDWPFDTPYVNAVRINIRIPRVCVLHQYNKIPKMNIRLSKKNLLIRDGFRCQYSNKRIKAHEATIDHVIPKSQGGKHEWSNVVISCEDINIMKGNKTPEQAGIKLMKQPKTPTWDPIYSTVITNKIHSCWKKFLKQDYNELINQDIEP